MSYRVAVLASGSGTNLQALLDSAGESSGFEVALVASNRDDAGALERARRSGVPAEHIADATDGAEILALLRGVSTDLLVLAGYLKLVPRSVVEEYGGRIINIHPALLPAFGGKGMYGIHVHQAVLDSGATVTGPTVHLVDEEYDRGRILAQWPVPVNPGDTAEELQQRVLEVEHRLLSAVIRVAARYGRPVPMPIAAPVFDVARSIEGLPVAMVEIP